MANQELGAPLLMQGGNVRQLRRVDLAERFKSESWLQQLLYDHPQLLPLGAIEPVAEDSVAVVQELPTDAGPLDLLLANPDGFLTLVETKLWRNPEARRTVVAQIIEYASSMARWDYERLRDAVRCGAPRGSPIGIC